MATEVVCGEITLMEQSGSVRMVTIQNETPPPGEVVLGPDIAEDAWAVMLASGAVCAIYKTPDMTCTSAEPHA